MTGKICFVICDYERVINDLCSGEYVTDTFEMKNNKKKMLLVDNIGLTDKNKISF